MDQFFTTDIFVYLLLFPGLFLMLGMSVVSDKSVTRVGVFFWGAVFIALAGLIAWQLITWRPIVALLVESEIVGKRISKQTFEEFDRTSQLLLWLVPFVTGSLGTNFISDSLTNADRYKRSSSESLPVQFAWWILKKLIWCLICTAAWFLSVIWFFLTFHTWPTKLRARAKVSRAAYLKKHAVSKQPWKR